MATLTSHIPGGLAKKVGTAIFKEHRGKLEKVAAASTASVQQLKNPDNLKDWFEVKDAGSVGKKEVDIEAFKKKIKLTITMVDYNKIGKALATANLAMKKLAGFDPVPVIEKRKKTVYKGFLAFGLSYARAGKDDPVTIKLAEKVIKPVGVLSTETNELLRFYSAAKSVFPRHQKMYEVYAKMFDTCVTTFDKLMSLSFHPTIQKELFPHYMACIRLRGLCEDGADLCKQIAKSARIRLKAVEGYRALFRTWLGQLGDSLAPVLLKDVEKRVNEAIKPATNLLKKLVGA